jgi:hypothetical protein
MRAMSFSPPDQRAVTASSSRGKSRRRLVTLSASTSSERPEATSSREMAGPFDEDADVRSHLAALGPAALLELGRILEGPSSDRTSVLRALTSRPTAADLATLIALADTDEVIRLRLLRAIRDLGA